jgi:peptide/nickel transport system permease protein
MKAPVAPGPLPTDGADFAVLTQWQLIRRRFLRHRLAVGSLFLLLVMYGLALTAGFWAPYPQEWREMDYASCYPQLPQFTFAEGLHFDTVSLQRDPITLKTYYLTDPARPVPLGFFVKGTPYRLFGLLPSERHFLGVDLAEYQSRYPEAGKAPPPFLLLGSDRFGHDIFSRTLYGSRISLSIGLVSIAITFVLGLTIGGISGYVGGGVDNFIQRLIEILSSFPQLPLWLAFGAFMPRHWSALQSYLAITLMLSLLGWTGLARVVRGKILALREEDYAVAARLLGASHGRILLRHLMPGFTSHIIVSLTLSVPWMILGETALSFLGLGLRPPIVSWGVMIQDCMNLEVVANYPWLMMPVIFIVLTVLAFNFLGDGLRDAADPYAVN